MLANFDLSASEDKLDHAHPGFELGEDTGTSKTNNVTISKNQKENQGGVGDRGMETRIVEESTEVLQSEACHQPTNEEPGLGIEKRGEEEQTTTDSRESSKKRKARTRTKKDGKNEEREEKECIHLQSRSRQVPVLPNTVRFELQKKYQLVKRLTIRGLLATYYVWCKNALEDCACLFIWCADWKPKMNQREMLLEGCKHDKQLMVRCNYADFE